MPCEIELKLSAARALAKLPRDVQRRIASKIERLASDPRPRGCEKLSGEEALFRIRVGDYRVIYQLQDDRLLVLVVTIGHRRDVYRRR